MTDNNETVDAERLEKFEKMLRDENVCNICLSSRKSIERFANAHGYTFDEWLVLMVAHNRRVEDEWLADYAKRKGKPLDVVRDEVYAERRRTQEHIHYAVTHGLC